MGKNFFVLLLASSLLVADDPCSQKGRESVPGQMVDQVLATLDLSADQMEVLAEIQTSFYQEFGADLDHLAAKRARFLNQLSEAYNDDHQVDTGEASLLAEGLTQLRQARRALLARGKDASDQALALLTESQYEALKTMQVDVEIPPETQKAAQQFVADLKAFVVETLDSGGADPVAMASLYAQWLNLKELLYIPDWLAQRMSLVAEKRLGGLMNLMEAARAYPPLQREMQLQLRLLPVLLDYGMAAMENYSSGQGSLPGFLKVRIGGALLISPLSHCQVAGGS